MRLPADLKVYLALVCLPAVLLAAGALVCLRREDLRDRAQAAELARVQIESLAENMRDAARGADAGAFARLAAWTPPTNVVARVTGRFVWTNNPTNNIGGVGLVRREGLDDALAARIAARTRWNEWTTDGRVKPRRGMEKIGEPPRHVLWARADSLLFGAVFDAYPLPRPPAPLLWPAGLALFAFAALLLLAGGLLLKRAAEKARAADVAKTKFLDNVSHELKTPCATIQVWSELLARGRLEGRPEQKEKALAYITGENARMIRLVEQLLDYARLEKGTRPVRAEPVDFVALAAGAVEEARGAFAAHGIAFASEVPPARAVVETDPDAMKQIVVNLISNAAKYAAAEGPVEVRAEAPAPPARFRVRVLDRGPGLSREAAARVFDRFYRARDAMEGGAGGLGLGLSISRALARRLGGDLVFAPRPGGGSVFTLEV